LKTFNKLKYPNFVQIYIRVYVYIAETKVRFHHSDRSGIRTK